LSRIIIKNTILALLLIVLLAGVFMIRNRTPFGKKQTSFAVNPENNITRIELSQDGKSLFLDKDGKSWKVNGKQEARSSAIYGILNAFTEMEIKSPVSPGLFEAEISGKNIVPVKIRVFEKRRLIRSFYVFRTGSNVYGNVMKLRPGAKPYIVSIPGFEGDIGSIFNPDELFWLPFIVFNLLPSEISSVSLENFNEPESSFRITNLKGQIKLYGPGPELSGWDTSRVRRYLSYFIRVPFESRAFDLGRDEALKIQSGNPLYRIKVTRTAGSEISLTLWEKLLKENGTRDSDRLWAKTGERDDLFIIRYFDIDPLLKKKSYFFTE